MSEAGKTCVFVIVAIVALGVAFLSRPAAPPTAIEDLVGGKNLNVVDDPLATQELEIIRWDSATGDPTTFQVSRKDGVWKIPSHEDYPADADRQIGDAATAATNLKPLGIVSDKQADHATYGVLDPETAKPGQSGVGTRVVMKDGKGESMVSTIIGKEVKDQPGQRYVRQVGKDVVYLVKIDPSKLSTNFEDWIEKDLLKLNTLDISQVDINDYSVNLVPTQGGLRPVQERRGEVLLDFNDAENTWSLKNLLTWDNEDQKYVSDSIPAGEEIDQVKLNDMKSALADLKIIDVQRKPAGMRADLRADEDFGTDRQAVDNLMRRGFYPVRGLNEGIEVFSSEGDFIVGLKDGVEYVLRFGGIKLGSSADAEEEPDMEKQDAEPKGENRYLLVAARYNPDVIPKPERPAILDEESAVESEPENKPEADPSDTDAANTSDPGEAPAENDKGDKQDGPPAAEPSAEDDAEKKEPAQDEDSEAGGSSENSSSLTPDQEDGAAVDQVVPVEEEKETPTEESANKPAETADKPEATAENAEANEPKKEPAADTAKPATDTVKPDPSTDKPTEKEAAAKDKAAPEKETEEKPATEESKKADPSEDAAKEREFAELAYNRAMDEYNDKVEKAQTQVSDLNDRFGDWYYVISDEVFRKIHITREDLFKKKEVETKEGAATDELQPKSSIPFQAPASIDGK